MGALLRILGGVWVGVGLIDLYMVSMEGPVTGVALTTHMINYVIPGLLVLGIGVLIGVNQASRAKAKDDRPSNDL